MMKCAPLVAMLLALFHCIFGKNDWSKVCSNGTCSFDLDESDDSMGGTVEISGSSSSISDITSAAGWHILNCTGSTNNQTLLMVCANESLGCAHLFQNGAQDTIVRLPVDCGSGPFVRVADHWIPEDQSLPANLSRRNSPFPQIHSLRIDDHFEKSSGIHGNVSFEIRAQGGLHTVNGKQRKRQSGVGQETETFGIVNPFVLFDDGLSCQDGSGDTIASSLTGGFDLNTTFTSNLLVISEGTLVPPSVTSLILSVSSTGNIEGSISMVATLEGNVPVSGKELVQTALPSFSIDGIVSIAPSFVVTAEALVMTSLQTNYEANIDFGFGLNSIEFNFPTNNPTSSAVISLPPGEFNLSMIPSANSSLEFQLNPSLGVAVEVSAFGETVEIALSHELLYSGTMNAISVPGNSIQVESEISRRFVVEVACNGPFLQTNLSANDIIMILEDDAMLSNTSSIVGLGLSPLKARSEISSVSKRDTFDCPSPAAVARSPIIIQGSTS